MITFGRRLAELERKRAVLVARAAEQRASLAAAFVPLQGPAALADRGVQVARFLKRYPAILAAIVAVTALLRPRRAWKWGRRAFVVWRMWRNVVRPAFTARS